MAEQDLPPQRRSIALYAAGGAFAGSLVAVMLARWIFGCC